MKKNDFEKNYQLEKTYLKTLEPEANRAMIDALKRLTAPSVEVPVSVDLAVVVKSLETIASKIEKPETTDMNPIVDGIKFLVRELNKSLERVMYESEATKDMIARLIDDVTQRDTKRPNKYIITEITDKHGHIDGFEIEVKA